jgi:hypothetical protein
MFFNHSVCDLVNTILLNLKNKITHTGDKKGSDMIEKPSKRVELEQLIILYQSRVVYKS